MESVKNNLAYLKEPKVKSQLLKNFQLKEEFIEMAKKTIGLFFDAIIQNPKISKIQTPRKPTFYPKIR